MSFPYDPDFIQSNLLDGDIGASVQLYTGYSQRYAQPVVYKVLEINPATEYLLQYALLEAQLAKDNQSEHICKVLDYKRLDCERGSYFCIVMERLESDWFKEIEAHRFSQQSYPEKLLWDRLYPLVTTLAALQERNIAHRDIKPHNIFLKGGSGQVKLGDFGSSKITNELVTMQTLLGTPLYLSPKAAQALNRGDKHLVHDVYKSDVYSLGVTFLHACYLELRAEWLRDGATGEPRLSLPQFPYSANLEAVLRCMMDVDEDARPNFLTLAGWLGVHPDINEVRFLAEVKCSQCAANCPNAYRWALPCGHLMALCSTTCSEVFLQQNQNEAQVMCRQCGQNSASGEVNDWCFKTIAASSAANPALERSRDQVQAVGVCEQCRRQDMVFQLCHPICWNCALELAGSQLVCQACRTRFPKWLAELLGVERS